jgi:hypothetical protein
MTDRQKLMTSRIAKSRCAALQDEDEMFLQTLLSSSSWKNNAMGRKNILVYSLHHWQRVSDKVVLPKQVIVSVITNGMWSFLEVIAAVFTSMPALTKS